MLITDLALLRCIDCNAGLAFDRGLVESDGVLRHGVLACEACRRKYPVIDGVGIFFKRDYLMSYLSGKELSFIEGAGYSDVLSNSVSEDEGHLRQLAAGRNWEYQWSESYSYEPGDFQDNYFLSDELFFRFIPIDPASIEGAVVFLGCTGKGREAYNVAKRNPAKIICCEIGSEIYLTRSLVRDEAKLVLLRCDVTHHPVRDGACDIAVCDHALQHILDHKAGFASIARVAGPGGTVAVCVYSHENNFIMTGVIEPMKKALHLLPLKAQERLSLIPAAMIHALIRLLYVPANKALPRLAEKLPLNSHMMLWSKFDFKTVWTACFDLIHAPISYHFRKEEIEALCRQNGLTIDRLVNTHGTTWSLAATRIA